MRFYIPLFLALLNISCLKGQSRQPYFLEKDTLNFELQNRKFWKRAIVPSVFFGLSALSWHGKEDVRTVRNRYIPDFDYRLDDYMQYAPAAAVFALNTAGVKGRNRPARTVINWGSSMLIMGGLVNALKYSSHVLRPDESSKNSFPSGHAAMAFMNASFLHKEYGHINSLYGIIGYAMGTYTGISRSLNNRHWISDILAGAGIGILSTELSYLIVDNLYKNKGDFFSDFDAPTELEKPSFLTIKIGQAFYVDIASFQKLGLEGALEGAFFFNKKWGIGAEIGFMHIPFKEENLDFSDRDELPENIINQSISTQSLGLASFMAGVYYSEFLGSKFILQAKLVAGRGIGLGGDINIKGWRNTEGKPQQITEIPFVEYSLDKTWIAGAGISVTAMTAPTIGLSVYADYKYANPKVNISFYTNNHPSIESTRSPIKALSCGVRFVSFFSL
jgi:hypothetical protein